MKKNRSRLQFFYLIPLYFALLINLGCATYQGKVVKARENLKRGNSAEAVGDFKKLADESEKDRLAFLLDYATALQIDGQYKESSKAFIEADKLADELDYYSVSQITAAALSAEEAISYKGESYEKILLNTLHSLNYLSEGNLESALVETRRINDKIKKIRSSGRPDYERNAFAHYLSAIIWEADRKYDDAFIEYEKAYEVDSTISGISTDLLRISKKAQRDDAYKKWKLHFGDAKIVPESVDNQHGEIIVLIQQGWGPEKHFNPHDYRFPILQHAHASTQRIKIDVTNAGDGKEVTTPAKSLETRMVYDVEKESIRTFNADIGWQIARRIGSAVVKNAVAERIYKDNKALGLAAWVAMRVSDRADLRQWSTLPASFHVARLYLKPGTYKINLQGMSIFGDSTPDSKEISSVTVSSGRTQFVIWRTLR